MISFASVVYEQPSKVTTQTYEPASAFVTAAVVAVSTASFFHEYVAEVKSTSEESDNFTADDSPQYESAVAVIVLTGFAFTTTTISSRSLSHSPDA